MKVFGWLFLTMIVLTGAGCAGPATEPIEAVPLLPTATQAVVSSATPVPQPTLTPSPAPLSGAACLPGEWQPADLRGQMERSLQASRPGVVLEAVEGNVVYRFHPDGSFELAFEQFEVSLSGEVKGSIYHTGSLLNGSAAASYQVDETTGELVLSHFGSEGVRMTATLNGQPLFEENLSAWPAFFASLAESVGVGEAAEPPDGEARLNFDCLESRMVLSRGGSQTAELELVRMP